MQLLVITGADAERRLEIPPWPVVVGRADGCHLLLSDPLISGRHLQLRSVGPSAVEVSDLGSTNGTSVDGQPVREARVVGIGATINVGTTTMRLVPSADGPVPGPTGPTLRAVPRHADPPPPAPTPAGGAPLIPAGANVSAGPIAGGNVHIEGEYAAGRDLHVQEGFKFRTRMRRSAKVVLWIGILMMAGSVVPALIKFDAIRRGFFQAGEDEISSEFQDYAGAVILGGVLSVIGLVLVIVALLMRREPIQPPRR
jgi:hypothetical protein